MIQGFRVGTPFGSAIPWSCRGLDGNGSPHPDAEAPNSKQGIEDTRVVCQSTHGAVEACCNRELCKQKMVVILARRRPRAALSLLRKQKTEDGPSAVAALGLWQRPRISLPEWGS